MGLTDCPDRRARRANRRRVGGLLVRAEHTFGLLCRVRLALETYGKTLAFWALFLLVRAEHTFGLLCRIRLALETCGKTLAFWALFQDLNTAMDKGPPYAATSDYSGANSLEARSIQWPSKQLASVVQGATEESAVPLCLRDIRLTGIRLGLSLKDMLAEASPGLEHVSRNAASLPPNLRPLGAAPLLHSPRPRACSRAPVHTIRRWALSKWPARPRPALRRAPGTLPRRPTLACSWTPACSRLRLARSLAIG